LRVRDATEAWGGGGVARFLPRLAPSTAIQVGFSGSAREIRGTRREGSCLPGTGTNTSPAAPGLQEIESAMAFNVSREGDVAVIDVDGQLIVGNRQELKQTVLDELDKGERKFLVDFSKTGYIDSSGLGVLVSLSKKIREQGGELRLASLNEDLRTLFELTKLDTLFRIADTREDGLEGF
jgi:anti-sigma B factor antagonist